VYKDILRSIVGIDIFPVFSLVVFLVVFTAVLVSTIRLDRRRLAYLSALPLDLPPSDGGVSQTGACASEVRR
jgi:cytochrome c oxidase cbb3-type subunit IV